MDIMVVAYSPLCKKFFIKSKARGGASVTQKFGNVLDVFNEPILLEIS